MKRIDVINDWWKKATIWERSVVSRIARENYDGENEIYKRATDRWWNTLTDTEKYNKFKLFFDGYY